MIKTSKRKFFAFLSLCAVILVVTRVQAIQASSPYQVPSPKEALSFVESLIKQGMDIANNPNASENDFGRLLEKNFVTKEIANFVLGVHGRAMNAEQKERFHQLYKKRLVHIYSAPEKINNFRDTAYALHPQTTLEKDSTLLVKTTFTNKSSPNAQPAKVDWKVVKKNNELFIYDILFEGISKLLTERQDYSAIYTAGDKGQNDPEKFLSYLADEINHKK